MAVGSLTAGDRDDEEGLEHLRVEQRVVPALQRAPVVRDGDAVAVAQRLDQAHDVIMVQRTNQVTQWQVYAAQMPRLPPCVPR